MLGITYQQAGLLLATMATLAFLFLILRHWYEERLTESYYDGISWGYSCAVQQLDTAEQWLLESYEAHIERRYDDDGRLKVRDVRIDPPPQEVTQYLTEMERAAASQARYGRANTEII